MVSPSTPPGRANRIDQRDQDTAVVERNARPRYLLGVDTGGTFTDAAILDGVSRDVVASAKALTTKGDLAVGVTDAIRAAIASLPATIAPDQIALVSVSTTLATNAVVEGHGNAVALVLIGFDDDMVARTGLATAFPSLPILLVDGGHNHSGHEVCPLDVESLAKQLTAISVSAVAIASSFAVRNPAHELAARQVVIDQTGLPCTLSTELSSTLDAPRRALTAVLNARLVSRVSALIDAVERSMGEIGLACPLLIVKGDGTLALAESVAKRPIETVLSGPAASLVGAAWLSGLSDFLLSDMGGTTTDLGVLEHGVPRTNANGAEVGGWRTTVQAIDVRTVGLGGDSEVRLDPSAYRPASPSTMHAYWPVSVGPRRIVPISLLAHRFPSVLSSLRVDIADADISSLHGAFLVRPFASTTHSDERQVNDDHALSPRERELLDAVQDEPVSARTVLKTAGAQRSLLRLQTLGLLHFSSFTPSDAAHVLGLQQNWSSEAALLCGQLQVRLVQMKRPNVDDVRLFAEAVWSETVRRSAREVLHVAMQNPDPRKRVVASEGVDVLLDAVCGLSNGLLGNTQIAVQPNLPLVAVGGPVKVFYPEVGRRLKANVVFPPFCDVANAVGAATASISRTVVVTIEGIGDGVLRVHSMSRVQTLNSAAEALNLAEVEARATACREVEQMGGYVEHVEVRIEKHRLPGAQNDDGLYSAVVTAEARGFPSARAPR